MHFYLHLPICLVLDPSYSRIRSYLNIQQILLSIFIITILKLALLQDFGNTVFSLPSGAL